MSEKQTGAGAGAGSERARGLLGAWVDAVNRGAGGEIAGLYETGACLLPTFSAAMLREAGEREGYFARLAGREGLRVEVEGGSVVVQELGGDFVCVSGFYTWGMVEGGEAREVPARFTFVFDVVRGKIVHHHSSLALESE